MPLCISCGEPLPEGKRKHAVYCDSKCRGKQYRKRHEKSAATDGSCQQRTSTVLECPCGRRYLLSVTELHAHDTDAVTTAPPASVTQTDSDTEEKWLEPRHADDQSVAQTVPQALSSNATQDRQSEQLPQADTQTVSNTEEKWLEPRHADDQSVAQTVPQALSSNATQDRQSEQLPQADTQTVSATTAHSSNEGNNRDRDRIMWEHIEKLLPKVLSDLVSRNNVTPRNKTTHQR